MASQPFLVPTMRRFRAVPWREVKKPFRAAMGTEAIPSLRSSHYVVAPALVRGRGGGRTTPRTWHLGKICKGQTARRARVRLRGSLSLIKIVYPFLVKNSGRSNPSHISQQVQQTSPRAKLPFSIRLCTYRSNKNDSEIKSLTGG